jgi:hypothetical protein
LYSQYYYQPPALTPTKPFTDWAMSVVLSVSFILALTMAGVRPSRVDESPSNQRVLNEDGQIVLPPEPGYSDTLPPSLPNTVAHKEKLSYQNAYTAEWPSVRDADFPTKYMAKFVTSTETVKQLECRSPRTGAFWGWADRDNSTHVAVQDDWVLKQGDTDCRLSTRTLLSYRQCDPSASALNLLCSAGEINSTLIAEGGNPAQGCDASDFVADIVGAGDGKAATVRAERICRDASGPYIHIHAGFSRKDDVADSTWPVLGDLKPNHHRQFGSAY